MREQRLDDTLNRADSIMQAVQKEIISTAEGEQLQQSDWHLHEAMKVDVFTADYLGERMNKQ
jgi:hypothetical protein